jgi:sugar/nucleoside kinase (ribokinase family)
MSRFLLVASAHIDRVWRLAEPLVAGGRQRYDSVASRYGGGGFNTGSVLRALGHHVRLATALSGDVAGECHRRALAARGFELDAVETVDQPTVPLEILLDPTGDRTILSPAQPRRTVADIDAKDADLIYLNVRYRPGRSETLARLADRIVSQLPLDPAERRPARILIASRSDLPDIDDDALMFRARQVAGPTLQALIVTSGSAPVRLLGRGPRLLVPPAALPPGTDTTGGGDFFAAGLLDALARGLVPEAAVHHAAAVAAQVLADRARYIDDRMDCEP